MKYFFLFALITGLLASCQSRTKVPLVAASAETPSNEQDTAYTKAEERAFLLADSARRAAPLVLPALSAADTLTPAAHDLLRTRDLAPLWANWQKGAPSRQAIEGFYGPDHYRISFYFDEVRRDSLRPEQFRVRGRNRYRKVITPFAGTITVQTVVFDARLDVDNSYQPTDSVPTFVVRATYELREDPATKGAGVYRGEALLDVYENSHGVLQLADIWGTGFNPTHGGGLLFRGDWTDNHTGRHRPAAWANKLSAVTPAPVMKEQEAGGRVGDVDPVLAKLGWNEFWENEEWWATSPKHL
ncbi:hypothetical protein [Hymenobacter negativus]|uniref:DUF4861 domain-containing protein n=1 Tax=Hymenobacter negativus TaxID=2795026 RepID=A0ABS3Q8S3_9BACT|nr:hypothetical protein [Hymenobacter negativus]MBO2007647.1 hypothetical protein [Hymenobacter negativus]